MKIARLSAQFPELKGNSYADGKGIGSTNRAAVARAFSDLFSQSNVKGKRITTAKITLTLTTETDGTIK